MNSTDLRALDPAQKRALLAEKLRQASAEARPDAPRRAPLSLAQQRLWFIEQMGAGQSVYTLAAALRLRGALDVGRLGAALDSVRARQASLRTRFVDEGGAPVQLIDPPAPLELPRRDLSDRPEALAEALQDFARAPFDLARGPLARCALYRLAPNEHVLAFAVHHIVADYHSLQVMIGELAAFYQDAGADLPPPPIQYADYALAQRRRAGRMSEETEYWRRTLDGLPPLLDMPTDLPRPARQNFAGARHRFDLPDALTRRIEALASARGATPFMALLAGFHILHQRFSGSVDICIGTTVSNRDRAELQGLVGYFVNTLALRVHVDPDDSFASLLDRLRAVVVGAMRRQEVPFEQVVDAAAVQRSLAHAPLFQSMFNLHEKQQDSIQLADLEILAEPLGGETARFDLCLDMFRGDRITGVLEYATALFRPETAARMAAAYVRILDAATAAPERPLAEIDLLDDADRRLLERLNDTTRPATQTDLASLISARLAERGEAAALIAGERRLTRRELAAAVERLAGRLAPQVAPGARIAVCLPRTADLVVALLAALKLGVAYVPLDPGHPPRRLQGIVEAADPALMIVSVPPSFACGCPVFDIAAADGAAAAPERRVTGADIAYVIFTSGTTGRPKGVPIRQESLVNLLESMAETPGMTEADTLVAVTTPAFDIAGLELFLPLLTGGTLVLADAMDVVDGRALARLIERHEATMMQATPATWRLLAEEGWRAPKGFRMLSGGEALDPALAARLLEGGGRLWNLYGPTETTIWSAATEITAADCARGVIPLGAPIANTTLHVLDPAGRLCPPGVPGELHIGGIGLSPGYLDRPDLTAARFIPDPAAAGARLYRTGDRVKRLADGSLVYLGRLDFQVKLRGFRIELGEIETILAADPAVEQAVVALRGEGDAAALVAYCRAAAAPDLETRLRQRLAEHLPGYMAPAAFVFLDAFPLNANGKVDRSRLPAPAARSARALPPETGAEALIAGLWADLLDAPPPGRDANFFALGGHSLLAMRMIARLSHDGPRATPLRLLFENPTLAGFAAALDAAGILRDTPPPPIPRLPAGAEKPLSYAQERQWTLATLDPGQAAYNIPAALRLHGPVDADRLGRAFRLLSARHETLRTAYPAVAGKPRVMTLDAPETDFLATTVDDAALAASLRAEAAQPFDLAHAPLARLRLYSTGETRHALLLTLHHIVGDAQSVRLLLQELLSLYATLADEPARRPEPAPTQYSDYAAWQRAQDQQASVQYWVERLDGAPPLLDLPTDFPRPAKQDFAGGSVDFTLGPATTSGLRALAAANGATPFMAALAMYAAFLGRYAEAKEVVVGTPVSLRTHPDLEDVAGMFVNTLAFRLPSDGSSSFKEILAACRDRVVAGLEHREAPFERVVEALSPERSWSHNPVFQAMFAWRTQEAAPPPSPGGLAWEALSLPSSTAKMDISLSVLDRGKDLALRLEYRGDLFHHETAEHMALAFEALADSVVAAPDAPAARLSLLHPAQARQIARWNDTGAMSPGGPATLHGLVSDRAARNGSSVAIRDADHAISYAALETRSDVLAAHLQRLGVGQGDRVGVALSRRIDLVVALLAVLKTGAAYVPMDPHYPAERIAYIRGDASLALLLTDAPAAGALDLSAFWDGPPGMGDAHDGMTRRPAPITAGASDVAYIIYTSGSTGLPKGVALTHGNAVALVRWAEATFPAPSLKGVLFSTSVCFDLSVFEIFLTLSAGGTLYVVEDLFDLPDAGFANGITFINTVPSPMAELMRLGPLPASVRTVGLAGEPLPRTLVEKIHAAGDIDVWNLYGPSEDTTYSTAVKVPPDSPVTIGRPVAGTRAHVLDEALQEAPPGLPGELYLSGVGVGRGYWNRPALTAERFLPNPFAAEDGAPVMYRTGDRVRRRADGELEYLGRRDRQVKVRGFRIEPGEVEAALARIPGVAGAAVDIWRDGEGRARLTAWVEGDVTGDRLAAALSRSLPAHMTPTLFVVVEALPLLPNGKLDRKALPAPDKGSADATQHGFAAPRPGLEAELAAIWRQALGRDVIDRGASFFSIGGDSILAIQVVAQARAAGVALSPRDLFQHPTIATLAEAALDRGPLAPDLGPATGRQALTAIQRWLLDRDLPEPQHWNQALTLAPARPLDPDLLDRAFALLAEWHDALRARFVRGEGGWEQHYAPPGLAPALVRTEENVSDAAARLQRSFDLAAGPLWGGVLSETGDGQRLAVAAHHLVVDGVSWRILLGDLERAYRALEAGETPATPRRGTAPGAWAERLAASPQIAAERSYWAAALAGISPVLLLDRPDGSTTEATSGRIETRIGRDLSARLLEAAPAAYPIAPTEVLAAALYLAFREQTGAASLQIELESHGRPDLFDDVDLSRTVGWLTALYPVRLAAPPAAALPDVLRLVKEALRAVPNDGVGYGVLRHQANALPPTPPAQARLNFLGQAGALFGPDSLFRPAPESAGPTRAPENLRDVPLEINAIAVEDGLRLTWTFTAQLERATAAAIGDSFARHLDLLVAHCLDGADTGFTPSDFPDMDFGQDDLDDLLQSL